MKNILMPKLSDTMTDGLLGSWLKAVGDPIVRGEIIAEVETDKATMGLEAFDDGVLLEQLVRAGETVPVGTVIGVMGKAGEEPVRPAAASVLPVVEKVEQVSADIPPLPEKGEAAADAAVLHREKASPVVRRRARELGIDLEIVQGSGPDGRVLQEDLESVAQEMERTSVSKSVEEAVLSKGQPEEAGSAFDMEEPRQEGVRPLSRIREAIAKTVTASWRDIPHFSVTMQIRMDTAEEVRRELRTSGTRVSINDMFIKGSAVALQKFPNVNAAFIDGGVLLHNDVNIGIMISVKDGLLVPVIKKCQYLSLTGIAEKSRQIIEHARKGELIQSDFGGGTFSISNLGAFGVNQFSAIILPPQVAILAVGAMSEALVPDKRESRIARVVKVTLSADHRVLDGVYASGFLQELRACLENPVRLLI
jgi:pyruvate dehydrogenase E2 component (dihydrolipoamide acetyltransferase)